MPISATNLTYDEPSENTGIMRRLGKYGFSGNATLPASNASCSVSGIGMITDRSVIVIVPWAAGQPLNENKYNIDGTLARTTGDNGAFIVQTQNTLSNAADQNFGFMVVNP